MSGASALSDVLAMTPSRVQLSRKKGWKMPPNTVRVCRPSVWGNPYKVGGIDHTTGRTIETRSDAVRLYVERGCADCLSEEAKVFLRGKNLACWCPLDDEPCHADVLLKMANA
jgi:hypothetical protein